MIGLVIASIACTVAIFGLWYLGYITGHHNGYQEGYTDGMRDND